jgi:hypothetical protein
MKLLKKIQSKEKNRRWILKKNYFALLLNRTQQNNIKTYQT